MNKKAYYRVLAELETELNSGAFKSFLDVVGIFEEVNVVASNLNFIAFRKTVNPLSSNHDSDQERDKVTKAISEAIRSDKENTDYMEFAGNFFQLQMFISKIIAHEGITAKTHEMLNNYLLLMKEFSDEFGEYRKDYSTGKVYSLSFIAQKLILETNNLKLVIGTILDGYRKESASDKTSQLELYLSNITSLKQFGIKLIVIEELYKEISFLLKVSEVDSPIVLEHLENGSLLATVSGNPLVVNVVTALISAAAAFFIARFSSKGEVVELKEKIEVLDKIFDLTNKLKENGCNVEEMQDDIQRSLVKLGKSMNKLLGDQPTIEVNEQVFELNETNRIKLIEESKRKLLENKEVREGIE